MSRGKPTVAEVIVVRGARATNLRGVDVDIPKHRLVVFTGVSGSGKSSLACDTIAAESQRMLNQTYPAFVQNLMPRLPRPDVDGLEHLSAAIVVDQAAMSGNPRSTVGTATDTLSGLRTLFDRHGTPGVSGPRALSFNDPAGACPQCRGSGQQRRQAVDSRHLVAFLATVRPRCVESDRLEALRDGAARLVGEGLLERSYDDGGVVGKLPLRLCVGSPPPPAANMRC